LGCSWCYWKALGKSNFKKKYFTIFWAKLWKILNFEWILFLEIQTNYQKNWVWKEKSIEPSMCSHLAQTAQAILVIMKKEVANLCLIKRVFVCFTFKSKWTYNEGLFLLGCCDHKFCFNNDYPLHFPIQLSWMDYVRSHCISIGEAFSQKADLYIICKK